MSQSMWKFPELYAFQAHPLWYLPSGDGTGKTPARKFQDNVHLPGVVSVSPRHVHFGFTLPQRQFAFGEHNRGFSAEGMYQSDIQVLKGKESRRRTHEVRAFGGFRKPRNQAGFWCGEEVGGTGTWYAQHKEAAACSFMERVLLVLGCVLARKVASEERPPCIWASVISQGPAYGDAREGGKKRGKAHVSTHMGP